MKKDFSLEEKLAAIKLVEQGHSARSVSRKLHLNRNNLYEWLAAYSDMGICGLKPKRKKKKKKFHMKKNARLFVNIMKLN